MKKLKVPLRIATCLRACTLILFYVLAFNLNVSAQTDGIPRGAQLPYTRYESENGALGGGASLQQTTNHDYNTIASEASNQKYVSLPSNGSYVEWTTTASAQGFNMRFTMPDNTAGTGQSGALSLFVNGTRIRTINLTSYWAYQYFHGSETEPVQAPGGRTFMRFDEIHFRLDNVINSGSTVRIVKENGDGLTYGVDFLELEPVPAALGAPTNSLSVTSYGANGTDQVDDFAAFNQCIADAFAQGKNVYIPAGRFMLSDKLPVNVNNMKIQGAGVWYTEIYFSTNKQFYGGVFARASNVEISDFSLNTASNGRFKYDEANPRVPAEIYKIYKGFMGTYGTGSRIHDVWVEHFECGFWIAGYDPPYPIDITTDLIITRARIRNNYADGVNFCQGTNNSVVEYSSIRNSGDDGLAMWPNNFQNAPQERNNIFRYNTIENIWRAGGIAIFGGTGHQVFRNIIKDGVGGSGIRFTQDFPGYTFEQNMPKIVLTDNYIVSCGTSYDLWNQMRGAIEFFTPRGIYDLEFNNTQIVNSQRHAINFEGNFNNVTFNNTKIDGTGLDATVDQPASNNWGGYGIRANASGNATFTTISYNRLESGEVINHNTGFQLNIIPGNVTLTSITLAPTSVSVAEGKTATLAVTYAPTNATEKGITWTTSNAAVATVVASGTGTATVTGKAVGTATITATSPVAGVAPKTCTVSVTPAVNIVATDATAGEGGNVGVYTISTSATTANITVSFVISGTASANDYTGIASGSVTLTPASPSATITVTPVDDTAFEGAETLTLTLQPGSGFSLGGNTAATITIADNENPPCTAPVIGLTSTAPTIDQTIDAAWSNVPAGTIGNVTLGAMPSDFAGSRWRAMYDATNLYVLVEVKDNNKFNDSGASWWEDDVVEIFIDGDNSKGAAYDGINDFQLGFRYNDAAINLGGTSVTRTTGITFAIQNITGGYNLEARIPWSTIGVTPAVGNRLGFEVEVDDDDNGGVRDSQVSAFATTSNAWSTPSVFGTVFLTTCNTPNVPVTGVTVSPTSSSLNVGATQQLTATVAPANATNQNVTWTTSNASVATVNTNGLVTAIANGTATITVTTVDGARTATCAITVTTTNVPVTGVTVSPTTASLNVGGTQQLTATVAPANATNKNVTWTTSNASVATVNASGLVTAIANGTATITVTTVDGARTATSAITISTANVPVTGVTVSPTSASLNVGSTQQLTATVAPTNATNKNVTWSTSNASVATVNTSGLVSAVAAGTATITVTTVDGARTATSAITVNSTTQTAYPSGTPWAIPGTVEVENYDNGGEGIAYHDNETANQGGQYRTTEGVDVEVCSEGGFNIGWTGTGEWLEYTVNVGTTGNYNIDVREASTLAGGTFHIEFNGVDKTGLFTTVNTSAWQTWTTLSKTGIALTSGVQVMRVYLDNANFNLNRITFASVGTNVPVTGVTVSPTSASIAAGSTQQLTATVAPSNATNKSVTWTSSNTAVASVNASGLVTAIAAGTATITVTTVDGARTATSAITVTGGTVTSYRIKNRWQNTYLYDAGDRVRYNATASGTTYNWVMEDVGGGQREIRNVGTGEYMHIENLLGYVQATARTAGWASARWTTEDAGSGFIRIKNVWQSTSYIHVENLAGHAQYGTINTAWWSAQWILEPVTGAREAEESIADQSVSFWPTVVETELYIQSDGTYKSVEVIDMLGRVHHQDENIFGKSSLTLDLSDLSGGLHFVKMRKADQSKMFRIVKK